MWELLLAVAGGREYFVVWIQPTNRNMLTVVLEQDAAGEGKQGRLVKPITLQAR